MISCAFQSLTDVQEGGVLVFQRLPWRLPLCVILHSGRMVYKTVKQNKMSSCSLKERGNIQPSVKCLWPALHLKAVLWRLLLCVVKQMSANTVRWHSRAKLWLYNVKKKPFINPTDSSVPELIRDGKHVLWSDESTFQIGFWSWTLCPSGPGGREMSKVQSRILLLCVSARLRYLQKSTISVIPWVLSTL